MEILGQLRVGMNNSCLSAGLTTDSELACLRRSVAARPCCFGPGIYPTMLIVAVANQRLIYELQSIRCALRDSISGSGFDHADAGRFCDRVAGAY